MMLNLVMNVPFSLYCLEGLVFGIRKESLILSLYEKILVRENQYFGTFYAVSRNLRS